VPVEIAAGLGLLRVFELALVVGLPVLKAMSVGSLIVVAPFGSLARSSKIDQFSHS
jgi:hypothetical protein